MSAQDWKRSGEPERETGLGPATLGLGTREQASQGVAGDSKHLQNQHVTEGGPSRASPEIAPNSPSFGALVVQAERVRSGGSTAVGPHLTAREVACRLRVSIATVYRLCETAKLPHVRVLNAVRVDEGDLRTYLQNQVMERLRQNPQPSRPRRGCQRTEPVAPSTKPD